LQMQCYQCEETLLNNDCSAATFIVNCTANIQDACQKEVMENTHDQQFTLLQCCYTLMRHPYTLMRLRYSLMRHRVYYRKACASYTTCLIASAGYQRFCSPGRVGSVCISCCNTPLCNGPRPPHTHSTAHTHTYTHSRILLSVLM
ncbi:hypothetical protein C0J50_8370, partial [Silurus asotus]